MEAVHKKRGRPKMTIRKTLENSPALKCCVSLPPLHRYKLNNITIPPPLPVSSPPAILFHPLLTMQTNKCGTWQNASRIRNKILRRSIGFMPLLPYWR